ncbi:MAG: amidohydrolase family protein [Acidobacteria bacterium]|nr:amidohydrolase family protein [Acidobacteriota bacterium]
MNKKTYLRLLVLILVCISVFPNSGQGEAQSTNDTIVIDGANIWDGSGGPVIRDGRLVFKGDRIQAVGPRASVRIPDGATVIKAEGKTLIPGLINAHGHVGMTRGLKAGKENYDRENILAHLRQYARYGVTTLLSLGTDLEEIFALRGPAKPDETPRATVFTAGRGFTGKAGYPAVLPGNAGIPREVDSVEEVRVNIAELAKQKVDMVKIWVDDHWGHYKKIRPDLYRAIISEAHKNQLRVMAHIFYLEDAKQLVDAGIDGFAHSIRDKEIDDALLASLKQKKTFVAPTLVREESTFVYAQPPAFLDDPFFSRLVAPEIIRQLKDPAYGERVKSDPDFSKYPGQLKMGQKNLKKLLDAGITLVFGSDSGPPARFQGFFEHRELELMVEAGLTPLQALQIATSRTAATLGISRDFGTLAKGKRADLILLDADPLLNISNTRQINKVWVGGRPVD